MSKNLRDWALEKGYQITRDEKTGLLVYTKIPTPSTGSASTLLRKTGSASAAVGKTKAASKGFIRRFLPFGGSKKVTRKGRKTIKHHKKVKSVKTHKKNKVSSKKK
jgi:hypothetical protein